MTRSVVDERRTVVPSAHMLDEVEKAWDFIAIVESGRVVAQGSIEELTATGQEFITIGVDRGVEAHRLLARNSAVDDMSATAESTRLWDTASSSEAEVPLRVVMVEDDRSIGGNTPARSGSGGVHGRWGQRRRKPALIQPRRAFRRCVGRLGPGAGPGRRAPHCRADRSQMFERFVRLRRTVPGPAAASAGWRS
ncbi:MAG: hypothetical protein M3083_00380 [Actinomycetota bacterium]|nr:hypothetical protein [Actinomycetota bacterium]MDQ6948323.1 hypothetical protein [Actinomycetota bacterium]